MKEIGEHISVLGAAVGSVSLSYTDLDHES